jgi:CBS domain-containing protein
VHTWELAQLEEAGGWRSNYLRVEQLMTADVFTVGPDDSIELVANMMVWRKIRHILVEDDQHRLLGLVSHRHLLRYFGRSIQRDDSPIPVREVMVSDPVTVSPDTDTLDAIDLFKKEGVSCLPVVKDGRLVGVITEDDFVNMAGSLLRGRLGEDVPAKDNGS